jgi:hypothetical protein
MKTLPPRTPIAAQLDDEQVVPDALIGRLHGAGADTVADVMAGFSLEQRANLAMFFYRKSHLHQIGLAIAATCDRASLIQAWGRPIGQVLFEQSREAMARPDHVGGQRRSKITLATSPTFIWDTDPAGTASLH